MNKSDLVKKLSSKENSLNEEDVDMSVSLIIKLITDTLNNSNRIEVRNFGTFSTRHRSQRVSRNPKTGTSILVQSKFYPYFRASKHLKESLNK